MIAWLDWAMLVMVKVGGAAWLLGCVAVTIKGTLGHLTEMTAAATDWAEFQRLDRAFNRRSGK